MELAADGPNYHWEHVMQLVHGDEILLPAAARLNWASKHLVEVVAWRWRGLLPRIESGSTCQQYSRSLYVATGDSHVQRCELGFHANMDVGSELQQLSDCPCMAIPRREMQGSLHPLACGIERGAVLAQQSNRGHMTVRCSIV
eukprot:scaffold31_cov312-Prasinococcus_capsulatus_cf.AAC.12